MYIIIWICMGVAWMDAANGHCRTKHKWRASGSSVHASIEFTHNNCDNWLVACSRITIYIILKCDCGRTPVHVRSWEMWDRYYIQMWPKTIFNRNFTIAAAFGWKHICSIRHRRCMVESRKGGPLKRSRNSLVHRLHERFLRTLTIVYLRISFAVAHIFASDLQHPWAVNSNVRSCPLSKAHSQALGKRDRCFR